MSAIGQSSISIDVEFSEPINGDATLDRHFPTAESESSVHEHKTVSSVTFPPNENRPIIKMNRNAGVVREKNIAPLIFSPTHIFCCSLPVLNVTHTTG